MAGTIGLRRYLVDEFLQYLKNGILPAISGTGSVFTRKLRTLLFPGIAGLYEVSPDRRWDKRLIQQMADS